jgi:hypothetical protein
MAIARELVLNQQRDFLRQTQSHLGRQTACFAEVDEILEGKGKRHWLGEVDRHIVVRLLNIGVLSQRD